MEKERTYSGLFIIIPEKAEAMDEMRETITSVIKENSGKIVKENAMGKRVLAYPIKKKKEAVYHEMIFTALPGSIAKMRRLFRINTDILRTLIDKEQ